MSEKAILLNDEELLKESKELYSQLDNFEYSKKRRKELHNQKYRQMKRKKYE
jgi:Ca-activated chloride channel family protein